MQTMTKTRHALIIASDQYEDPTLRQLVTPAQDARALAQVLRQSHIGDFDVQTLLNEPAHRVNYTIETFFVDRRRDDVLLLYFSGHGIKDEDGRLYFAARDTQRKTLRTTATPANLVNEMMRYSRSQQQILLLDCCYSGAFARGMTAKGDAGVDTRERFKGRGRVVLTASDAIQYAFEGDEIQGEGANSVFTRFLVQGLKTGAADLNRDGRVTLDELYEYVHRQVIAETPHQEPRKWAFDIQGEIVVAHNPNPLPSLPYDLVRTLQPDDENDENDEMAPLEAVEELIQLTRGDERETISAARELLQDLSEQSQNHLVRQAARRALDAIAEENAGTPSATLLPPALPDRRIIKHPIPITLNLVPAGPFLMGSDPAQDPDAQSNEQPQHPVYLPAFYIARRLVTNEQYATFVQATGRRPPEHWRAGVIPAGKADHPVVYVSLYDAQAFCQWLSEESGEICRLPTEAEWEKAARGPDANIYPWGNEPPSDQRCNFNSLVDDTTPVGRYSPQGDSAYGCADMAGNVWEWTISLWGKSLNLPDFAYPYNPRDGREAIEANKNIHRIWRGGALNSLSTQIRSTYRNRFTPDLRDWCLGFRVVLPC